MPSIRSYFFAKFYDATMREVEEACLGAWRAELLAKTTGDVLEIGAGTGVNLPYYPAGLRRLVLSEPDDNMRSLLSERAVSSGMSQAEVIASGAEGIDHPDASFDGVVSTLVLCSAGDPATALREIYRVLRPGGVFFVIEHVLAEHNPRIIKWQRLFNPIWKFMCCGCHLTRNTAAAIEQAGFVTNQLEQVRLESTPAVIQTGIKGMAIKPLD